MTTVSVPLSDDHLARLRARAEQAGVSPEEFLRRGVERLLDGPADAFPGTADYVLRKNAELYRRLA